MCAKLPIVATRVDGAPEAIDDGISGYLLKPRDVDGMSARILDLLDNPSLRSNMGLAGLQRVDPAFCDRDMVRRIQDGYSETLPVSSRVIAAA